MSRATVSSSVAKRCGSAPGRRGDVSTGEEAGRGEMLGLREARAAVAAAGAGAGDTEGGVRRELAPEGGERKGPVVPAGTGAGAGVCMLWCGACMC